MFSQELNVLVIGSTHSFSEGGESGVVHENPFNPAGITNHLQRILSQDAAITDTVNVVFEDTFNNDGFTSDTLWRWTGDTLIDLAKPQALKMSVKDKPPLHRGRRIQPEEFSRLEISDHRDEKIREIIPVKAMVVLGK